ncbi:hypothetical protein ACTJJ0_02135 [Chitinophaga sp. 22321]|uniref:Uncharacterized protein n=1 Tax=Chitinophaga hostae TaxID=2831022 RepID=A0ABS5IUW0_9BACT|nr:hypothetical protein [Chitinophaga hostae]MBS0026650.1 hypothetical protein [Chitinophaga hostae]
MCREPGSAPGLCFQARSNVDTIHLRINVANSKHINNNATITINGGKVFPGRQGSIGQTMQQTVSAWSYRDLQIPGSGAWQLGVGVQNLKTTTIKQA